jgi:hypothetical protein
MFKNKKITNNLKNKPLIIYWAPFAMVENQYRYILLDMEPIPLKSYVIKNKAKNPELQVTRGRLNPGGYHTCSAMHELAVNTFILKAPFDSKVDLDEDGFLLNQHLSKWFVPREKSLDESLCIDFDIPYLFFSEESVSMRVTPPYMTKTVQQDYGFPSAVKYDISKWFRPLIITYQLWSGIRSLEIKENDPLLYINFETDRPIILKQFELTQNIVSQAQACMADKDVYPRQKMQLLYNRFQSSKMNEIILKEIKNNLID